MRPVEKKPARRRGPRPTLDSPTKLTTNLTRWHADALADYAERNGVSMSLALRRAIEALVGSSPAGGK